MQKSLLSADSCLTARCPVRSRSLTIRESYVVSSCIGKGGIWKMKGRGWYIYKGLLREYGYKNIGRTWQGCNIRFTTRRDHDRNASRVSCTTSLKNGFFFFNVHKISQDREWIHMLLRLLIHAALQCHWYPVSVDARSALGVARTTSKRWDNVDDWFWKMWGRKTCWCAHHKSRAAAPQVRNPDTI